MDTRPPAAAVAPPDHSLRPDAFISYARTDKALVRALHEALAARQRDVWVDWEDIHPSEKFMEAIERAIEAANAFVFVISPDSIRSTTSRHELEHAVAHGKKLIPIVYRDSAADPVPASLAALDWIFARTADDLAGAVDRLCRAIDTDLDWVRTHTRLLVRAVEWDRSGRNKSFLLQGVDLDSAERTLAHVPATRTPQATTLQREYLLASRRQSTRRLRVVTVSVALALVVALLLAWLADYQRRQAEAARRRGLARQLAAQSELVRRPSGEPLTVSALLASESLKQYSSVEGDLALRRALALLPRPPLFVGRQPNAADLTLSPDGRWLAAVEQGGPVVVIDTHSGRPVARLEQPRPAALFWSPDARRLLTLDEQEFVRIWTVEGGTLAAGFGIQRRVDAVAFSADGTRVAVIDQDDSDARAVVSIRDVAGKREVARFSPSLRVQALALDSTGRQVTTLADSFFATAIEVREEPFGKVIAQAKLDGHVEFSRFNAAGTLLAFVHPLAHIGGGVSGQQEVAVYSVEPAFVGGGVRLESTSLPHPCKVNGIELSPEGHQIVTTCEGNTVRAWSADGSPVGQLTAPGPIAGVAVGPEAATVAVQGEDGFAYVFALPAGAPITSVHHQGLRALAMSADGQYLTLVGNDGTSGVWETRAGSALQHLVLASDVRSVHFAPDGSQLAVCTGEGASLFQLRSGATIVPLTDSGNALGCAFSPDGRQFFTVSAAGFRGGGRDEGVVGDDDIRIWDAVTGRLLGRRQRPAHSDMAISDNGQSIAISEEGRGITIAEVATGRVVRTLDVPAEAMGPGASAAPPVGAPPRRIVSDLRFSPAGDHLAVVYDERRTQVWDLASGTAGPIIDLAGRSYVSRLSPNGRTLVTVNHETMRSQEQLWDGVTGRPITLGAPNELLESIVFSADGRLVAAAVNLRTVRVWDFERRRLLASMVHPEEVYRVSFDPAGTHVATGGADRNARVWEIASGREMARMAHDFPVFDLAFDATGRTLAVGGLDPNLWLELWRPEDLIDDASKRVERNLTRAEWERYLPDLPCRATFPGLADGCPAAGDGAN